ncbi:MAG TPA: hypothetical protein VLA39_11615 [Marinobacterium sp.]|nr:hypothetical protein [Marinobacterium sp.]
MKPFSLKLLAIFPAFAATTALAFPQAVSKGDSHNLFLDSNGNVYVAGTCETYAVCGPIEPSRRLLATYAEFQNAKFVLAGASSSAVVNQAGELYYAGTGRYAGDVAMDWARVPAPGPVVDAEWNSWKTILFLVKEGGGRILYQFDMLEKSVSRLSDKTNWRYVTADPRHNSYALDSYGDVYSWGPRPAYYGDGAEEVRTSVPDTPTVEGKRFVKLTAGSKTVVGLTDAGATWAWGDNGSYRMLGDGTTNNSSVPVAVLGGENVRDAVAVYNGVAMISNEGQLLQTGWTNLSYKQPKTKLPGTDTWAIFKDSLYTQPITASYISHGWSDSSLFIDAGVLYGYSSNQYGELAMNSEVPEFHEIARAAAFVGTPPPPLAEEDLTDPTKTKVKSNASANNGKSGNYERSGHVDSGLGNGRTNGKPVASEVFSSRADGRGFKRSKD